MARNSEIFAQLDPAVVKKLEEKQIRYTRYLIDEKHKPYASWQQSFMTDDRKVRLFSLYRIALAPARKPYPIGLLLTHKNGDFGAVSAPL